MILMLMAPVVLMEVRSTFAERVLGPLAEAAEQLRAASAKQDFGAILPWNKQVLVASRTRFISILSLWKVLKVCPRKLE